MILKIVVVNKYKCRAIQAVFCGRDNDKLRFYANICKFMYSPILGEETYAWSVPLFFENYFNLTEIVAFGGCSTLGDVNAD